MYKVPEESIQAAKAEIKRLENEIKELNGVNNLGSFSEKWQVLCTAFRQDKAFMAALAKEMFPNCTEVFPKDTYVLVFFGNYRMSLPTNPKNKNIEVTYIKRYYHDAPKLMSEDTAKKVADEQQMADLLRAGNTRAVVKFLWPNLGFFAARKRYKTAKVMYPNRFKPEYWQDSVDKTKKMYEDIFQDETEHYATFLKEKETFQPILKNILDVFNNSIYKVVVNPTDILKEK